VLPKVEASHSRSRRNGAWLEDCCRKDEAMFRTLLAAATVYAYGHPAFDGYRPGPLDKPMQSFYADINDAARDGKRALVTLDDYRCMRYLNVYIERMDAQLRGAE
jgi:hypothetical protein